MDEKWKCNSCGGINPAGSGTCLGCDAIYVPPDVLEATRTKEREEQDERIVSFIRSKKDHEPEIAWEYCLLLSGSLATEGNGGPQGGLLFLSDGDSVDLPTDTFVLAIRELGLQGWEVIEAFSISDLERQYPVKNLRPLWSYVIDAALNEPAREGIYEYETIREANGIFFLLKRPMPNESA